MHVCVNVFDLHNNKHACGNQQLCRNRTQFWACCAFFMSCVTWPGCGGSFRPWLRPQVPETEWWWGGGLYFYPLSLLSLPFSLCIELKDMSPEQATGWDKPTSLPPSLPPFSPFSLPTSSLHTLSLSLFFFILCPQIQTNKQTQLANDTGLAIGWS